MRMLEKQMKKNDKLFITVLITMITIFIGFAVTLIYVSHASSIVLYKKILNILLLVVFMACIYMFISIVLFIRLLKGKGTHGVFRKWIQYSLLALYPIILFISQLMGLEKERIQSVFSVLNNRLILAGPLRARPEEILVLLPHCLQKSSCSHKITGNIYNCQRCGLCDIDLLFKSVEQYKTSIYVATGGTLARKIVKDLKPKVIIAVACERDLSSGILDIRGIPVIGITIDRPEGPCVNTRVNMDKIAKVIKYILSEENVSCTFIHHIMVSDREWFL